MTAVRIVSNTDPSDVHEIEVGDKIGTSNYERMLDGLYMRVDFDRYHVDSEEADAEHERRRAERSTR